jgi:translation initiation factor 6 (eIF-6)
LEIHHIKENKMAYTLDTKVGEILKDTHAVEILEKHVPGISKNPMIGMASGMTLKAILAMPQAKQAGLTEEKVEKVLAEINAVKK